MNFREGMRRLGILTGAAGGIMGGFLAFVPDFGNAPGVWNTLAAHRKFEGVMTLPTVQKAAKAIAASPAQSEFVPPPLSSHQGRFTDADIAKKIANASDIATPSVGPRSKTNPLDALPPPSRGGKFGGIPVDSTAAGAGPVDYDALAMLAREHGGKPVSTPDLSQYGTVSGTPPNDWVDVDLVPNTQDGGFTILPTHPLLKGNRDGIMSIQFDSGKRVTAIGFSQPYEWVYRTEAPKFSAYLVVLAFPVFGFLLPWAVVRLVTWVGTGFFTPKAG